MAREVHSYSWINLRVQTVSLNELQGAFKIFMYKPSRVSQGMIIKSNSGKINSGTFVALMGPSGCGKTSFLNALAFRPQPGVKVLGKCFFDDKEVSKYTAKYVCSYIPQDDLFFENLTVGEHLTFQAGLRLSSNQSQRNRDDAVDQMLTLLNLHHIKNNRIGNTLSSGNGISKGERKRIAFAAEMLSDLPVILVDEPTSGLDSHMASVVVKLLYDVSRLGKIVIASLHQPSSQLFKFFDKIFLLSDGVKVLYGTRQQALELFSQSGFPVPENYNPVDWFILNTKISYGRSREHEDRRKVMYLADMWHLYFHEEIPIQPAAVLKLRQARAQVGIQFKIIIQRLFLTYWRQYMGGSTALILTLFGLYLGVIFYNQADNVNQNNIRSVESVMGIQVLVSSLIFLSTPKKFKATIPVVVREIHSGLYYTIVYKFCIYLVEVLLLVLQTVPGYGIMYWMVGMNPLPLRFIWSLYLSVNLNWIMLGLGHILSNLLNSDKLYVDLSLQIGLVLSLFSGLIINLQQLPTFLYPFRLASPMFYGYQNMRMAQWLGMGAIPCHENKLKDTCFINGMEYLRESVELEDISMENHIIMTFVGVIFRVFAVIVFLFKNH